MRYSRMKENEDQARGGGKGTIIVVILVLAAVLYMVGASEIGDFLSKNVVTPVVAWVTGETPKESDSKGENNGISETPAPSGDTSPSASASQNSTVSKSISVEANTVYALQVGVFDEEKNAEELAQELKNKGGAGYILEDGDSYRVIISAYQTEAEAKNVKTRLLEEQKLDSKLYNVETEKINVELSAPEEYISELGEAIEKSQDIHEELLALSLTFDKGDQTIDQIKTDLQTMLDDAQDRVDAMNDIDKSGTVEAVASIRTFYDSVVDTLSDLIGQNTQVNMSSGIKEAYMEIMVNRKTMITSFE